MLPRSSLRKISRETYLLLIVPPQSSLTACVPFTCYNAAAEAAAPPLQQREWRRCSSSLFLVLLLCAVLQADAVLGSRSCTDSVLEACTSRRPGAASSRISGEQYSAAAWGVPSAEILNIQAKRRGLMQGWEIIKRSALCCLCLSLSQYF